eukprot:scaffold45149_cov63-Phaeocystis_antarctica.AAC.5
MAAPASRGEPSFSPAPPLLALVVARVVPAVANIERGVIGKALGPACDLLELLSEGVVPRACPRPRGLDEVARLLPRSVRVQEQVGEEAARPTVEALRAVDPHRLAALQALADLARVSLEELEHPLPLGVRGWLAIVQGAEPGGKRCDVALLADLGA